MGVNIEAICKEVEKAVVELVDQQIERATSIEELAVRLQVIGQQMAFTAGTTIGTRIANGLLTERDAHDERRRMIYRVGGSSQLRTPRQAGGYSWTTFATAVSSGATFGDNESPWDKRQA